ncbi:hypothetical protein [Phenylobacterium sp.]|uniref:hypothetical protein n=1 Tax=Phenylobacterium sp. TaxID=1871053 RepID=UPI002C231772|nr:hypothetical protein [Phenylobacterium sp.]HLZ77270.1 hypothetical protein [Phenylobacterium sp.]
MAGFSPSDAALEGFRLTRENPKAFGIWAAASLLVNVLSGVIDAFMPASVKHGLETISASDVMTGPQLLDALILTAPVILLGLAVLNVMAAAVYRLIFRHDDTRFGYLRLGADELRLMGLTLIYIVLFIALVVGVGMVSGIVVALAGLAGPTVQNFLGWLSIPVSFGVIVYVLVRLSLAPVATFAERRLAIFESWGLTRGQFWRLFGAYVLALACVVVVGFLALVVFTGAAGVVVLLTGGKLADLGSILNPKDVTLSSYLSIGLIASMILSSVFSALWNAVMAAPGAVAYQQLHGDPPPRPLSVQPEAG